ncbi:LOW QUALITY PROTEIN: roundabout homolog 2-like [Lethenteron reissneri]|uniref:LOW QUALITY PROTEIN: roundabout homolog 2-like n=1 Tax=Lethenteron reissneri TaxID=7753 RepID=UPI002AB65B81|nr:LOW QUALITY PROTEIN: roundabout homolog 2-like [Lethenteron reissneri]
MHRDRSETACFFRLNRCCTRMGRYLRGLSSGVARWSDSSPWCYSCPPAALSMGLLLVASWSCATAEPRGSRLRQEDAPPRIAEHPSDLIVSRGEPATLNCKAEGRPVPTVEWYKDGERVETDRDDPRSHRMLLPTGSLFFLRIVHGRRTKTDEGSYVCVARNYLGEAVSRNASLEVAILRDEFRQNPSDVVVAAREPAVMECLPPRGHPEPTVSWKRNGVALTDKDERVTIRGGKLMISNTQKADAGMYVCVGTNMVGERDSEPAELAVFERPTFARKPMNLVMLADSDAEFRCEVHGDPPPTVRWRKEDGDLPKGRFEIQDDYTLRVERVGGTDEGTYTCVGENRVGKAEASASLVVHAPPQFVVRPRDQIVAQGQSATFLCETTGNPPPAVFWQREGSQNLLFPNQPSQPSSRFSVSQTGHLTITDVQRSDSGYYTCQALSVAGSILAKALLEVGDALADSPPPIIRQGPANQTLAVGSVALLACQAMGMPTPSVHWLKDGSKLSLGSARLALQSGGTLSIKDVQLMDAGLYTCVAVSPSGETTWSAFMDVQENGVPSQPQPPEPSSLAAPPSKPRVTDVTKNTVTLSWQLPEPTGPSPILYYIIEAFSQSVSTSWQTVATHVTRDAFTLRGLRPNTIYLFIVRAANAHGLSDPSPVSDPVRTQDISPTGQGVDHRQVQKELGDVVLRLHTPLILTSSTVQVTWTVDRQSQFVQGYRLMHRPVSGTQALGSWQILEVKSPTERNAVLTNLRKGLSYEIKVRPFFNEFQGADSDVKFARTPEEAPDAPPQAVTVNTMGGGNSTSISVTWDSPPAENQNGLIQEYRVWCLGNETRFHVNKTVAASVRSLVLSGLVPGVPYRVEVAAATAAGVGVHSEARAIQLEPVGGGIVSMQPGSNVSLAGQISDVVKQPAFIAGIGGACWVILMSFSVWLYCRRKKRKGLSNYAVRSFTFTPAVTFQRTQGTVMSNGRPGVLNPSDPTYPWLADSWPSTALQLGSGANNCAVSCCPHPTEAADQGFSHADASFSNMGAEGAKSATLASDGAIYSSIDVSREAAFYSPGATPQATPYATTQIIQQNIANEISAERGAAPAGPAGFGVPSEQARFANERRGPQCMLGGAGGPSQDHGSLGSRHSTDRSSGSSGGRGKKKSKSKTKAAKAPGVNWSEFLPPPPSHPPPGCNMDQSGGLQEDGYDSDDCGPPLPVRMYLHGDGGEEGEGPSGGGRTHAVTGVGYLGSPSPGEARHPNRGGGQGTFVPIPRAPSIPHLYGGPAVTCTLPGTTLLCHSEPERLEDVDPDGEAGSSEHQPLRNMEYTLAANGDHADNSVHGSANGWDAVTDMDGVCFGQNGWARGFSPDVPRSQDAGKSQNGGRQRGRPPSPVLADGGPGQRPRAGKKSKHGSSKMDDLPPPPLPPPMGTTRLMSLQQQKGLTGSDLGLASRETRGSAERLYHESDEGEGDIMPYSKPYFPSRGHVPAHSSLPGPGGKGSANGRRAETARNE